MWLTQESAEEDGVTPLYGLFKEDYSFKSVLTGQKRLDNNDFFIGETKQGKEH